MNNKTVKLSKTGQPIRPANTRKQLSLGQKAADRLTRIVGSWVFIISILVFLVIWITLNAIELIWQTWDPYPFILLNFFLSCTAAIQAPIILMSQNRTAERDETRAEYDYLINRKAEREIQRLHDDMVNVQQSLHQLGQSLINVNSQPPKYSNESLTKPEGKIG